MGQNFIRDIQYYRHYYRDFFDKQTLKVQKKLNWTLQLVSTLEQIPIKYFKHLEGTKGLYEIRAEIGTNIFRVFLLLRRRTFNNSSEWFSEKNPKDITK